MNRTANCPFKCSIPDRGRHRGPDFLHRVVEPICRDTKPDLIWIDPLLSFLGGDAGRQEVVSPWLRNHLNPILHRYAVGCVLIHHVNKPASGKEKSTWQAGDLAYLGSGSAELANWPRAVIAIRSWVLTASLNGPW